MFDGGLYHPRLRGCLAQMALGSKMGAAIGGIFGILMGGYQAIAQRNLLILPVAAVGGAVSFGFFLGCGMIVRCDDGTYVMMTAEPDLCPGVGIACLLRQTLESSFSAVATPIFLTKVANTHFPAFFEISKIQNLLHRSKLQF